MPSGRLNSPSSDAEIKLRSIYIIHPGKYADEEHPYLLAYLSRYSIPSAEDLPSTLETVGYEIDNERMKLMLSQMKGQDKHLPWLLLGRSLLQSQAVAVVVVRYGGSIVARSTY